MAVHISGHTHIHRKKRRKTGSNANKSSRGKDPAPSSILHVALQENTPPVKEKCDSHISCKTVVVL